VRGDRCAEAAQAHFIKIPPICGASDARRADRPRRRKALTSLVIEPIQQPRPEVCQGYSFFSNTPLPPGPMSPSHPERVGGRPNAQLQLRPPTTCQIMMEAIFAHASGGPLTPARPLSACCIIIHPQPAVTKPQKMSRWRSTTPFLFDSYPFSTSSALAGLDRLAIPDRRGSRKAQAPTSPWPSGLKRPSAGPP